jgi:prepilin-type N-terminal cleavage/methylation domain-containing protein
MKQAFTLIELLIVVAIIGILAAIAVPNFLNAQIRARIAKVRGDFHTAYTASEMYHIDNNSYPYTADRPDQGGTACGRHRPMTTPIAYMPSALVDPFGDPLPELGLGRQNNYHCYDFFFGKPGDTYYANWLVNLSYEIKDGMLVRWQITSQGPDEYIHTGVPYSSTNGLHSAGDIKRWGPGNSNIGNE